MSAGQAGETTPSFELSSIKQVNFTVAVTTEKPLTQNIVAIWEGSDPILKNEYVAVGAHYDHVGIGTPVNGDSIYNGAADNASGVATILAIAHTAAEGVKPRRSQMFVFVTAEESGLLGSEYFGMHPPVPATNIIADLNVDNPRLTGRFRTIEVLGDNKSSLGPLLAAMLKPSGINLVPEAHPEQGHFYRSDHFSFAKVGIPAVDIKGGVDIEGKPLGWGLQQAEDYTAHRYHQPSDEYKNILSLEDAAQLGEIVYRFGFQLANAETIPTWNKDAEFRAAREAALRDK